MSPLLLENPQRLASGFEPGDCTRYRLVVRQAGVAQIIYVRLHPSPEELYERERNAFRALPPEVRAQYSGRWVAVHNGNVVASGISDTEAARQFLREFGDTHVFVGYIGEEPPAYQISPRR